MRHVPLLPAGPVPTGVELRDALPLRALLTPVGSGKEGILGAIEALAPASGPGAAARPLGEAVQALLRYLAAEAQQAGGASLRTLAGARILAFLSGPPNWGRGSVVRPRAEGRAERAAAAAAAVMPVILDPSFPELSAWGPAGGAATPPPAAAGHAAPALPMDVDLSHAALSFPAAHELEPNWAAAAFYESAGAAAAALGACVDLFAVCPSFVGLPALAPLATATGGASRLYTTADPDTPLPQVGGGGRGREVFVVVYCCL